MAWVIPAAQLAMGAMAAMKDKQAADKQTLDWNNINERNAQEVAKVNKANAGYGREILDMGTPDMRASQMGDLLFSQGQEAQGQERDRALKQAMMTNLRRGQGSGNAELQARFAEQGASQLGDKRALATLQGIQGVMPSQAALQTGGALLRQEAPQLKLPGEAPMGDKTGGMLGSMGNMLGGMKGMFG